MKPKLNWQAAQHCYVVLNVNKCEYAHLYVRMCMHHIKNLCGATGISLLGQYTTVDKYLIAGRFDPKVVVSCFQVRSVVRDAVCLYVLKRVMMSQFPV